MTREEKIELLTKELLEVINTPSADEYVNEEIQEIELKSIEKTLGDLKSLNVDTNVVRQIMQRVDEVYGRKHSNIHSKPLYEEFTRIIKSLE
jgi:hypothetical protein